MPTEREIFTRLFIGRGPMRPTELTREIMVLGFANFYKWDQVFAREEEHGGEPISPEELARIHLTEQQIRDIEDNVKTALQKHVESVQKPPPGFWYGVWQGIVSAFLYSMILVTVVLILVFGNVSVPTLLGIEIRTIPASSNNPPAGSR